MQTIALIIYPNQEIVAIEGLMEPKEPMHSGYVDEEREIMGNYYKQWRKYNQKLETAIMCDQVIAEKVLAEQYPKRKILKHIRAHYNVVGITINELCGKNVVDGKLDSKKVEKSEDIDDDFAEREAHYIIGMSLTPR